MGELRHWAVILGTGGDRLTLAPLHRCAFFHGEVDKPTQGFLHRGGRKPVTVAINLEGVHVIDHREKVRPAPGWDLWAVGDGDSGVLTQAFLVPLGLGGLGAPPSLGCPWGLSLSSGAFLPSVLGRGLARAGGCGWD